MLSQLTLSITQSLGLSEKKVSSEKLPQIRLACGRLSCLFTDIGRPSPLWAAPLLGRWPRAMRELAHREREPAVSNPSRFLVQTPAISSSPDFSQRRRVPWNGSYFLFSSELLRSEYFITATERSLEQMLWLPGELFPPGSIVRVPLNFRHGILSHLCQGRGAKIRTHLGSNGANH